MTVTVRYAKSESYSALASGMPSRPYIAVRLQSGGRHVDTMGLVDSGADTTIFHEDFATPLGLVLDPSLARPVSGIGGGAPAWFFDLYLSAAGKRFRAEIGFSQGVPREFGLLGRADFFMAFNVGFSQRTSQFLLHPLP